MKLFYEHFEYKVSFTSDCWTPPNNISFMGIAVHHIDKDWKYISKTVDFKLVPQTFWGQEIYIVWP